MSNQACALCAASAKLSVSAGTLTSTFSWDGGTGGLAWASDVYGLRILEGHAGHISQPSMWCLSWERTSKLSFTSNSRSTLLVMIKLPQYSFGTQQLHRRIEMNIGYNCLGKSRHHISMGLCLEEFAGPRRYRMLKSRQHSSTLLVLGAKGKIQLHIPDAVKVQPGKYCYDVENAINQLSSLASRASFTRVMDSFRNKLSMKDFSFIFGEFGQRGDWERSLKLFRYMQRQQWCKPQEYIYTILIGILGREGLLDKCNEVFEEMPSQGVDWNVYLFTALINAYGRNGQYEASLHLLSRMKRERVTPNLLTYNTVINACAKGGMGWEGLLSLFAQMRHEGIQPDIITYNTLLGACSTRCLSEEAKMVFRTMNEAGVVPDQVTYNVLVETFRRMQQLEVVSSLLHEMEVSGNVPDAIAYNALIDAFSKEGRVADTAAVFKQMFNADCSPNVNTYIILLECYGKHGRFDDVRELFNEMKASGTVPDVVTYNTLIDTFGKGGYYKEVISLFDAMVDGFLKLDMNTYKGLLHACGMTGLHQEAKTVYEHLIKQGLTPEPEIFEGLIQAYGKSCLYQEAEIAFNTMYDLKLKPNMAVFNSLFNVFGKGGLYTEAGAILLKMQKAGLSRTVDTYNSLIEAFCKAGLYPYALAILLEMRESSCLPNMGTYEALLNLYCDAEVFDEANAQFLEMKESDTTPTIASYCLMLSVSARRARWDYYWKILEEMEGKTMPSLHVLVAGLIQGNFDEASNWKEIVEPAFDMIKINGVESNMTFYNALLEALWRSGQRLRAMRVWESARRRGIFPEAFSKIKTTWLVDVHRMSVGAALTAIVVWLQELQFALIMRKELPQIFSIVTKRSRVMNEKEYNLRLSRAVHETLESINAPFKFAPWNDGRIVSFKVLLVPWLNEAHIPEELHVDSTLPVLTSPSCPSTKFVQQRVERSEQLSAL